MADRLLTFQDLLIRRMPGFEDEGFALEELDPQINIVAGLNASGKTTAARALTYLLWPEGDHVAPDAEIRGHLLVGDTPWLVGYDRGHIIRQRDGVDTSQSPVGLPRQVRNRYRLALHDLIRAEGREFAEQILKESVGGFDLGRAGDELNYSADIKTRRVSEYSELNDAKEHLRSVREKQETLKEKQRRLEELERQKEEAEQAQKMVEVLERAVTVREAEERVATAREQLSAFPDALEAASGDEPSQVERLRENRQEAEEKRATAQRKIETARAEIESLDLPSDGIPDHVETTLSNYREELRHIVDTIKNKRDERESKHQEAREILGTIDPDLDPEEWEDLNLEAVGQLDQFVLDAQKLQHDQTLREAVDRWFDVNDEKTPDPDRISRGIDRLGSWLAEHRSSGANTRLPRWTLIGAVGAAVASAVLTYVAGAWGLLLLAVAGALLLTGWIDQLRRRNSPGAAMPREEYEQLDLEPPANWTVQSVKQRLKSLHATYSEALIVEKKHEWRELHLPDLDQLEARAQDLQDRERELRNTLGTTPPVDSRAPLAYFLQNLREYQRARTAIAAIDGTLESLRKRRQELLDKINITFGDIGYETVNDLEQTRAQIEHLRSEVASWKDARRTIQEQEDAIEEATTRIERTTSDLHDIYEKLNLEPGQPDELNRLVDQLDDYQSAREDLRVAENELENARRNLEDHPAFEEGIGDQSREQLRRSLQENTATANTLEEIKDKIREIETLVKEQQRSHDLEEALQERDKCLDNLRDLRDQNIRAVTGQAVLNVVREKTRDQTRPAVFHAANDLFGRITRGRYKLQIDDTQSPQFRAMDTRTGQGRTLDELSSGTRIQLLLAVRMAFVEAQESDVKIPILADEVLANSDDLRAQAIIEALLELCRDGRQLFYFTAQADEVYRWQDALDASNVSYTVHPLGQARVLAETPRTSRDHIQISLHNNPVEPDSQGYNAYGEKLDVPDFDPLRHPTSRLHLWYLMRDEELLYRCLAQGIETWGMLRQYIDSGGSIPQVDEADVEEITTLAEIADRAIDLYRQGRPVPVERSDIEESEAVSETFMEDVTELLTEIEHNPRRLIARLREGAVARFRTNKIDELEDYFVAEGHINGEEPLSVAQIEARISAHVSQHEAVDASVAEKIINRIFGS